MKKPLIWINGFPGAGKYTVAKALAKQDPTFKVIDNHKLIDPVAANFARDHPEYQAERQRLRQQYLDEYVRSNDYVNWAILFTDFQSTTGNGPDVAQEYATAAQDAARLFIPVYLTCDREVNMQRAVSGERTRSGTTKLTDEKVLRAILSHGYELHRFYGCRGMELDTTVLSPEEAARSIWQFVTAAEAEAVYQGVSMQAKGTYRGGC